MDGLETLVRLGDGRFIDDLASELMRVSDEVVKKSQRTGREGVKGRVTVAFEVEKAPGGDPTVIIRPAISIKMPAREPAGKMFFALEGEFHSSDPRQPALSVRVVDTSTGEIREAPAEDSAPVREI